MTISKKLLFILSSFIITNVDAVMITKSFSGSWQSPTQTNQRINMQVVGIDKKAKLLVTLFTENNVGEKSWLQGIGEINRNRTQIDLYSFTGPTFNSNTTNSLSQIREGKLKLEFDSCDSGKAYFVAENSDYNDFYFNLKRNSNSSNTECTGGLLDNLSPEEIPSSTTPSSLFKTEKASSLVNFIIHWTQKEVSFEYEDLPLGYYELKLDNGDTIASTTITTEENISIWSYSSPKKADSNLLDFEVLGHRFYLYKDGIIYSDHYFYTVEETHWGCAGEPQFPES